MENTIVDIRNGKTRADKLREQQILQGLPVAVYTCDAEGYVTFYNKAAAELWGREPETGRELWCGSWKIFSPLDGSAVPLDTCPMAIALKEGRSVKGEEIIVERPDGTRRNVCPYPEPIFDRQGNVIEAINTLIDITELKQAQRQNEQKLENLVMERTRELQKANRQLQKSNIELEQFAFVASHDLQEPVRKILSFSELLEKRLDDREKAKNYIDRISTSAGRMLLLTRSLLNYSKVSRSTDEFETVDLNGLLEEVRNDLDLAVLEKDAVIASDSLPRIEAVPIHISQLFYNLLGNALKFSAPETRPIIRISSRQLSGEETKMNAALRPDLTYYEITVKDNGIGFSQAYAEKIFDIFQRLHDSQAYPGAGIGLALCKNIALHHHGEIFAAGSENKGAEFHVLLPERQPV